MTTLAERNNNPLNLRPLPNGQKWQGQVGVDTNPVTGSFCVFKDNAHGIRAAVINLRSYIQYHGVKTLADAIYRWAPPPKGGLTGTAGSAVGGVDQNHTEAYIKSVCQYANVVREFDLTPLVAKEQNGVWLADLKDILIGMNRVEAGGQTVVSVEVDKGIRLALNIPEGYERQDDGNLVRTDPHESEIVKESNRGLRDTGVITAVTAATPAIAALNGMGWEVVAILVGAGLLVLAGVLVYRLFRVKKERIGAYNDKRA